MNREEAIAMKITWIGHSCFKVESGGYELVLDPYCNGAVPGLADVKETADAVLCSHEHGDHNARGNVTLRTGGTCPFKITEIAAWHDDTQGSQRGSNTIHVLDDGHYKIAHMGDLGCDLTPEQVEKLSGLDCLLIPVGGFFTIDGAKAAEIVKQLKPVLTIPMHFRSDKFGFDMIGMVDEFTSRFPDVDQIGGSSIELETYGKSGIALLEPKNLL